MNSPLPIFTCSHLGSLLFRFRSNMAVRSNMFPDTMYQILDIEDEQFPITRYQIAGATNLKGEKNDVTKTRFLRRTVFHNKVFYVARQ